MFLVSREISLQKCMHYPYMACSTLTYNFQLLIHFFHLIHRKISHLYIQNAFYNIPLYIKHKQNETTMNHPYFGQTRHLKSLTGRHSHMCQPIKGKQPVLSSLDDRLSSDICLQKSARGGRVSIFGLPEYNVVVESETKSATSFSVLLPRKPHHGEIPYEQGKSPLLKVLGVEIRHQK